MKRFISFILLIAIIFAAVPASAKNSYIKLMPLPYSTHTLGEEFVIYGDTDCSLVYLTLCYPKIPGYEYEDARLAINLTAQELREGYVIKTDTSPPLLWPEGAWRLYVTYGAVQDYIEINMTRAPVFDRCIRVVEYEDNAITNLTSYFCRGIIFENNTLTFTLEDGTVVKIFSWDNFAPTDSGESRIFIATYEDGYMTDMKTYYGDLVEYGKHINLKISDTKSVKLLYWDENLKPIK